ncbi:NUDIX hydrolase [Arthrobacter sp. YD2]|uniref:NUDIX domain-containing protein n=1 Tax=Arthrobacter sp. YD2 TaxID=3058046 RepID=UPI0025B4B844|nr:NUDIX hydrolase [Arthrobacter sp. YD2]MDN3904241.1 NUDIX hydrolase [Arthrobacter sp. YD2]
MAAPGLSGYYGSIFKRSTTAGAVIRTVDGGVLLLRYGTGPWQLPAGVVKAGEDPRTAARRIARETLDPGFDVGRVLAVDYLQGGPGRGDSIAFLFDGGTLATTVAAFTGAGGGFEARFLPAAECRQMLDGVTGKQLAGALQGLELGTTVELVDGVQVPTEAVFPPPLRRMMPPLEDFSAVLEHRERT